MAGNSDQTQLSAELAQVITRGEQAQGNYDNQIKSQEAMIGQINKLTPTDLSSLTEDQINKLLKDNFDVFDKEFYYLPGNTDYEVCIEAIFQPDPTKYDLSDPNDLARAYADAAIPVEVAGNQEYVWGLSQVAGIATFALQFTPPSP